MELKLTFHIEPNVETNTTLVQIIDRDTHCVIEGRTLPKCLNDVEIFDLVAELDSVVRENISRDLNCAVKSTIKLHSKR